MSSRFTGFVFLFSFLSISLFALEDVTSIIRDFPMYKELEQNETVSRQFLQYMEWVSDKNPDGKLVFGLIKNNVNSIDAISTIFHEKVEFYGWLNLGHRFENIVNLKYYQKHYLKVYPIAHRKALLEEINLLKYFAQKKGFNNIPEIAYNLVSPLIERHNVPVSAFQSRVKYSFEYQPQIQFLTENDIETAIKVYEDGGYTFKDKNRIVFEAMAIISNSKK